MLILFFFSQVHFDAQRRVSSRVSKVPQEEYTFDCSGTRSSSMNRSRSRNTRSCFAGCSRDAKNIFPETKPESRLFGFACDALHAFNRQLMFGAFVDNKQTVILTRCASASPNSFQGCVDGVIVVVVQYCHNERVAVSRSSCGATSILYSRRLCVTKSIMLQ